MGALVGTALLVAAIVNWGGSHAAASGLHPSAVQEAAGADFVNLSVGSALAFVPNSFEVTPGNQVQLVVTQLDGVTHTFTLSSVANYSFKPSNTTADLVSFFATHRPLVNLNLTGTTGTKYYANFTAPAKGSYEYVCLIAPHFQNGMYGLMGSGVSVSVVPPSNGPGLVVFLISGTIVAFVVLALILGFVLGKREGAKYEMPPERLGYPEPTAPKDSSKLV